MPTWADTTDPRSLSTRFRARRDEGLRTFILGCRRDVEGPFRILDLGGRGDYWRRVGFNWLAANDISVTCVNQTVDEFGSPVGEQDRIAYMVGDACNMTAVGDGDFDMVHSNSVIEHVGRWPDMRRFANEVRRIAPFYYVQTPYFWFPVDPHFYRLPLYHWLPESLRAKLHLRVRLGHSGPSATLDQAMAMVNSNVLLDRQQYRSLFPCGSHRFERFFGLPKSMIVKRGPNAP